MTLTTRLKRLEQKAIPGNPLEELTDQELDAAIAALDDRIRTLTGLPPAGLAQDTAERQKEGLPPPELSQDLVCQFVRSFKAEFAAHA